MSLQKSEHYQNGTQNGMQNGAPLKRQTTVNLDPLSAAHVYYGESHSKKDRVRTYSSVRIPSLIALAPAQPLCVLCKRHKN
jgi:hypothetical protein